MKAVAYVRVSTDDKGQDPRRQEDLIRTWASREGVELVAVVADEGTSASTVSPLSRPKFLECLQLAQGAGVQGIVAETVDRITREGVEEFFFVKRTIRVDRGLDLWMADQPRASNGEMAGRLMAALNAEAGAAWVARHKSATSSGMARARASGARFGRTPKPPLSDQEYLWMATILAEGKGRVKGQGLRAAAWTLSVHRGAAEAHDPATRRERAVTAHWLLRQLAQRSWCRPCWLAGRRNASGNFQPGHCATHPPPAYRSES